MRRLALWGWILVGICPFITASEASCKPHKNFVLLKPETCFKLDQSVVSKLPEIWHRYSGHVKECPLNEHTKPGVSVVSIWILDYFNAKFPPRSPHVWEDFPLPVLVDDQLNIVGQLPEHYPDDPPRELNILYSPKSAVRPEVKVTVSNPAVGGDYFYGPMTWDKNRNQYLLKNNEVIYGK